MRALNKVFKVHAPIDRYSHGTDTLIQIEGREQEGNAGKAEQHSVTVELWDWEEADMLKDSLKGVRKAMCGTDGQYDVPGKVHSIYGKVPSHFAL